MYKNNDLEMYDEDCELNPGNHGLSKFSMEKAAAFLKMKYHLSSQDLLTIQEMDKIL